MEFNQYLLVIWSVLSTLTVVNASENIASGKPTNQSTFLRDWDSSKAVDGCTLQYISSDCCAHTAGGQTEAWWQVDLQAQSVIETVNIIYRDENTLSRLAGFEIYLSNTHDWTSGERCYQDTTVDLASISATQSVLCAGVARYLTIYNDRRENAKPWYSYDAILELCEVYVNGCPVGKYGNGNCNNYCINCLNNICHATSGTCDVCAAGFYRVAGFCVSCPVNCEGNKCDNATGACSEGCSIGFSGAYCRCPFNCRDFSCPGSTDHCTDRINGFCTPCPAGCSSDTCDKTSGNCLQCNTGFHGSFCNQTCPVNCKNNVCNMVNGQCPECDAGLHGSFCTQTCPVNCTNNVCNMVNGQCQDCNDGYYGPVCITYTEGFCTIKECDAGLHGSFCTQTCPVNCKNNVCNMVNGQCQECYAGLHGSLCTQQCPVNCKNNVCNMVNGQCQDCYDGYYGSVCTACPVGCSTDTCDKTSGNCLQCDVGFHGSFCNQSCPDNCNNCNIDNGQCIVCLAGYHGSQCLELCGNCRGVGCDKDTGYCMTSCIDGWTGNNCDTKVAIVMKEEDVNAAAVGIGVGFGVVILALVIMNIVLVRRMSVRQDDTTNHTQMTNVSTTGNGQDLHGDHDRTYEEVSFHTNGQSATHISPTEGNYEKLGHREIPIPHVYDTTNFHKKT